MGVNDNQMGMRVTIHEQNTSPDIGSMGIDIEPGKSTTIVLSTKYCRYLRLMDTVN